MEENKTNTEKKLSYEQLMKTVKILEQRADVATRQLMSINMTTVRLQFLFMVLQNSTQFPVDFVGKCSKEIMDLLEIKEDTKEDE